MYAYVVQNPWTSFDPEGLAEYNNSFLNIVAPDATLVDNTIFFTSQLKRNDISGKAKAVAATGAVVSGVGVAVDIVSPGGKAKRGLNVLREGAEQVVDAAGRFAAKEVKQGAADIAENTAKKTAQKTEQAVTEETGAKTYQTYTKTNPNTGEVYSGRTSGTGTPAENIANRDKNHHKSQDGFGPAQLDQTSANKDAIRGREQQLIDQNGGAKSQGGNSGNAINSVSPTNTKATQYQEAAKKEFEKKK